MDLHTLWRHKGTIFGSVNSHCCLMDSLTPWRHKGTIFRFSELQLSSDESTYHLWTQAQHICISEFHCHLMDSLTSWRHKGSIFVLLNSHSYLIDWFTYFLKTQAQHICVTEFPLPFNGSTYCLKTSGQHTFVLVNHSCHLMHSHTVWRHKSGTFVLVCYHHCDSIVTYLNLLKGRWAAAFH